MARERCSAGFQSSLPPQRVKTRIQPFGAYVSFRRVQTLVAEPHRVALVE
jgi:hypothetical protein